MKVQCGKAVEPEGRMEEEKGGEGRKKKEQNISWASFKLLPEAVHFMPCFIDQEVKGQRV